MFPSTCSIAVRTALINMDSELFSPLDGSTLRATSVVAGETAIDLSCCCRGSGPDSWPALGMTLSKGVGWFTTQYSPRLLQTDLAGLDLVVEDLIKPDKVCTLWMIEIYWVGSCQRIIALAHQIGLGAFERAGELKLGA